jgi:hypothetical protein
MKTNTITYLEAVKERRTNYTLTSESTISDEAIQHILEEAILHAPSSFNAQNGRAVLLLGEQHQKLWNITREALRAIVPAENFPETDARITSFQNGYGSILFLEDTEIIKNLELGFPVFAHNFKSWSLQSIGMLQHIVWTAFNQEGLGASLQHYNELIETQLRDEFQIPKHWKLISQMPFGKPSAPAGDKEFAPLADRLIVLK